VPRGNADWISYSAAQPMPLEQEGNFRTQSAKAKARHLSPLCVRARIGCRWHPAAPLWRPAYAAADFYLGSLKRYKGGSRCMAFPRRATGGVVMSLASKVRADLEKVFENTPGLPLVAAAVGSMLALVIKQSEDKFGIGTLLLVYAGSYLFYRAGGLLDDRLFTPLYGSQADRSKLKAVWRHGTPVALAPIRWLVDSVPPTGNLATTRTAATQALASSSDEGLYSSAKHIFGTSEEWRDKVKPVLEVSKAARSLVLPLLVLAVLDSSSTVRGVSFWPGPASPPILRALANPWVALALAGVCVFGFLYFRVWHMVALYRLVTPENTVFFQVEAFRANFPAGDTESAGTRTLLSAGTRTLLSSRGRLADTTQLPIFRNGETLPNFVLQRLGARVARPDR
jgi:hypothetical protein